MNGRLGKKLTQDPGFEKTKENLKHRCSDSHCQGSSVGFDIPEANSIGESVTSKVLNAS